MKKLTFALICLAICASLVQANTYTVINTNDSGIGSLREAVKDANTNPGADTVAFDIPTGDSGYTTESGVSFWRIQTNLPPLNLTDTTGGALIDGSTQTANQGNTNPEGPEIVLDGSLVDPATENHAFGVNSDDNWIKNLVIQNYSYTSIGIEPGNRNRITSCYIGTDPTGMFEQGNGQGIYLASSCQGNIIGGTMEAERNIISGNGFHGGDINGITFYSADCSSNEVRGNYIGINKSGTAALANNGSGIFIGGSYNIVNDNVISGNNGTGLSIVGSYNAFQGNVIGLNAAGTAAVKNGSKGVHVSSGNNNLIGGAIAAARNVISGNSQEAIGIEGSNNQIFGNYLGVDATGQIAIPQQAGVKIISGNGNIIENNVICGSTWMGVLIGYAPGSSNEVKNNYIGLAADGVTLLGNNCGVFMYGNAQHSLIANNTFAYNGNSGSADVALDEASAKYNTITRNLFLKTRSQAILLTNGANENINPPYINLVSNEGLATMTVSGTAPVSSIIEIFQAIPPSTEANAFLGSVESSAVGDWSIILSGSYAANEVAATATDRRGNTSQFSINNVSTTTTTTTTTITTTATSSTLTTTTTRPGISEVTVDATPAAIAVRFQSSQVTEATFVIINASPPPQVIKEVRIPYVSVGQNIINIGAIADGGQLFDKHTPYAYKLISEGRVVFQGTFMIHD